MQYWKLLWVGLSVSTLTYNVWWCNRGSATRDQLTLLNLTQCRLLSGSKTIASVACKLNFEKVNILDLSPGNTIHTNNFSLRKIGCGKCNIIPFNVITIDRFHCHTINMAQKKNWKPSSGRSQENETLQKSDIHLSKSQVYVAHSFWVICWNISRTIVELCMETPYLCKVFTHKYGRQKSAKFSSAKLFLSTRELASV